MKKNELKKEIEQAYAEYMQNNPDSTLSFLDFLDTYMYYDGLDEEENPIEQYWNNYTDGCGNCYSDADPGL